MGSIGKAVKKIAKPEIILPIALIAATGGLGAGAAGAAGAGTTAAGTGAAAAGTGGGLGGLFSSIFGGTGAAGTGGLGSFLTSKKFLLPQLISAGTQLATTGKIDPKQQLLAAALSGVGGLGQGATAAEKAALAQRTAGMSAAEAAQLQAGYAGMSKDAALALSQGANPFASTAAQEAAKGIGYGAGLVDPGLAQAAGMGTAAAQTAGTMSALPAINPTLAAQANPAAFQTFLESAPLTQRLGQTAANLTRGLGQGLANPLSKKGLMSYGALGTAGMLLNEMGKPQTEAQKNLGVDAQAQYDLTREMNRMMGGAYTDEQLNAITAPMLSQYGGEYETVTNPFQRKRRPMFPGLNYSGLTRYAADGGSIKPKKRSEAIDEILNEAEQREIILDALYGGVSPGANEEAMANQMFDLRRRQRLNPMGRKDGGRIGLANGGDLKYAVESFIRDFPEFEDLESKKLYKEMEKRGYLSDRDEMKKGGLMQLASAPDPMDERNTMMENLALDKFGKSLDRLKDYEIIQIEEMIENMLPMAMGGSVPQTERIPNGMQIDGRGGGFIPMGAQEKKDDVPAMLAKNEFVMTSDAVKAAGGGDINKGAQKMYDLMNNLESRV